MNLRKLAQQAVEASGGYAMPRSLTRYPPEELRKQVSGAVGMEKAFKDAGHVGHGTPMITTEKTLDNLPTLGEKMRDTGEARMLSASKEQVGDFARYVQVDPKGRLRFDWADLDPEDRGLYDQFKSMRPRQRIKLLDDISKWMEQGDL